MEKNLYVPLMNSTINEKTREEYLTELNRLGTKRIFIAIERNDIFFARGEKREKNLSLLKGNVDFFKNNGFVVGIWFAAFGSGAPLLEEQKKITEKYVGLRSVTGRENKENNMFCPESDAFMKDYLYLVKDLARINSDMLMLDDDLCLSVRPGLGCFCDKHLALLEKEVGEKLDIKDLKKLLFVGGKNKYRSAWLKVNRESMLNFAKSVRRVIDDINPNIRAGFCSGFTSWDIEGADAIELTKALAGNTKPFVRTTGAPYWASKNVNRFQHQPLSAVVEETRRQEAYARNSGVEIFFEADSYPRPRYAISSSLLENFALPLYASGGLGELGYFLDYVSSPSYERGYADHRIYNKPLYSFIKEHFEDKTCTGVKVMGKMRRIENAELLESMGETAIMTSWFNRGAEFLSLLGVPSHYENDSDCGVAFGEEARGQEKLCKKMIVDIKGALILQSQGYDLGLIDKTPISAPEREIFGEEIIRLSFGAGDGYFKVGLKDGAKALSYYQTAEGEKYPSCYTYSANGIEYLVFTFDVSKMTHNAVTLFSYKRAEQVRQFVGGICYVDKSTFLYQICKENQNQKAILFVNMSENPVINGKIALDKEYKNIKACGTSAELKGKEVLLSACIPPYGAFAVVLEK